MSAMDTQKLIVSEFGAAVIGADHGDHLDFVKGHLLVLACTVPVTAFLVILLTWL